MTIEDIVNETIEFYQTHPRSVGTYNGGISCMYLGPNGDRCAFSRCCVDSPQVNQLLIKSENDRAEWCLNVADADNIQILKDEYIDHVYNSKFWNSLQSLHDSDSIWDEESPQATTRTLNSFGRKKANHIISQHTSK